MGASYKRGVRWIAENDEPSGFDLDEIRGYISVLVLAEAFDKDSLDVARDVLDARVTVYTQPPGQFVHLTGRGNTLHYGEGLGHDLPICGAQVPYTSMREAPDPELSPDAKLCPKCKREALDRLAREIER